MYDDQNTVRFIADAKFPNSGGCNKLKFLFFNNFQIGISFGFGGSNGMKNRDM